MHVTDLGGHSGCRILLCEKTEGFYVRKISCDKEYNERLKNQAEKQNRYHNKFLKVPAIYSMGETDDGLFYFDMEYIQGITLAEYMKIIEVGKVRNLAEMIVSNLFEADYCGKSDEEVFSGKIVSLKKTLFFMDSQIINEALKVLDNHSWDNFHISPCHGDLTLENIMVKDHQLYLIDFLDSFYDCWLLDIGTLLQDVQTMWSYRNQNEVDINTVIRLIVFRDILLDKIREICPEYVREVYYALLLKLIRIYPYVKDKKTYEFLNEKTASVLEIIREG